ncbi:DUF58 domain-containing protein [Halobellus captivus]|uniref:DUF58 domain-containing protein n=1 Tax=Halobellus captivus TaxID=2592614 RepID=UPI00119EA4EA|nr:DUF58 domain-containing protein [Halobellus captivus]
MLPTRRWAVLAGTACFFAAFAAILGEATPLYAAGGLSAWLLLGQADAIRTMRQVERALSTDVSVATPNAFVGDRTAVTVDASLSSPVDAPVDVELVAPPSVSEPHRDQHVLRIDPGETSATTTCSVTLPVAGRIRFDTLRLTIGDRTGYFTESIELDADARVLVDSPSAADLHVGQGGRAVGTMFGEHPTDQTGPGLVPHETRQYVMGDTLSRIDWKTTARMNQPYIREYESESDYQLSLVFDAGSQMRAGPTGRTKHAYAREIALGFVHAAESYGDPIRAHFLDDDGTHWRYGPSTTSDAYQTIRNRLLDSRPAAGGTGTVDISNPVSPSEARQTGQSLDGDSPFATTLRPFLDETATYISRVSDRPLFNAVKTACGTDSRAHLVLITDDTSKVETYEAIVLASQESEQTSVFLTPSALFDRTQTAGTDGFVEFEAFRRRLNRLRNVTAYEVAPRPAVERARTDAATAGGDR